MLTSHLAEPPPAPERPLSPASKLALMASAALAITLFYVVVGLALLLLLLLLSILFTLFIVLLRFGLSGLIRPALDKHFSLLKLVLASLWLRNGRQFSVPLFRDEAPRLFAFLEKLCQRFQVPPPRKVVVEMSCGAWVLLQGFRQGSSSTTLGLGFDLLAGLSEVEVEAVLAHEMAHAKLVRRGFKRWLNKGLSRAAILTNHLSEWINAHRRGGESFETGETLLFACDKCLRLAARLIAAYSRQDEFEADLGAAAMCGPEPLASALIKLESIQNKISRIGWNERMAMLQRDDGFSTWLVDELSVKETAGAGPSVLHEVFNPYSTHPSTADRIAVLNAGNNPVPFSPPAIHFFPKPDEIASKLMTEIQRMLVIEEEKDTKERRRWLRKFRAISFLGFQWLGIVMVIAGILSLPMMSLFDPWTVPVFAVLMIGGGIPLIRYCGYRDRHPLPIPGYAKLKELREPLEEGVMEKLQEDLRKELREKCQALKKNKAKVSFLLDECNRALAGCDYLKAHVASRLSLEWDTKNAEVQIVFAIASANFGQYEQASRFLAAANQNSRLSTNSTLWGAGWVLALMGEWAAAESLLLEALRRRPGEPTLEALLALCQSQRGKLQSALLHARNAFASGPEDLEKIKLLAGLLIDGGYLQEAKKLLASCEDRSREDSRLALHQIRLRLLQRSFDEANNWVDILHTKEVDAGICIELGEAFEKARLDEKAVAAYGLALGKGHYPEAELGLARLALHHKDKEKARAHLLRALDQHKKVGDKGRGPFDLFDLLLGQLLNLEEPRADLKAWIAHVDSTAPLGPLAGHCLLVFARDQQHAETFLTALAKGLNPDKPPLLPSAFYWKPGAQDQQPVGLVCPGIYRYWKRV